MSIASLASATASYLRSEEHTSELSHVEISYAVFCLKKKKRAADRDAREHPPGARETHRAARNHEQAAAVDLRARSRALPPSRGWDLAAAGAACGAPRV